MKSGTTWLIRLFVAVMLAFALLMAVWVPLRADLDFRLADTALSLETSQGRERRQTMEYNQVKTDLPAARAQLSELQPQADAAAGEVQDLKDRRRTLRDEKKALEAERND